MYLKIFIFVQIKQTKIEKTIIKNLLLEKKKKFHIFSINQTALKGSLTMNVKVTAKFII